MGAKLRVIVEWTKAAAADLADFAETSDPWKDTIARISILCGNLVSEHEYLHCRQMAEISVWFQ